MTFTSATNLGNALLSILEEQNVVRKNVPCDNVCYLSNSPLAQCLNDKYANRPYRQPLLGTTFGGFPARPAAALTFASYRRSKLDSRTHTPLLAGVEAHVVSQVWEGKVYRCVEYRGWGLIWNKPNRENAASCALARRLVFVYIYYKVIANNANWGVGLV